jgi:8-oxo-dGTP pyrophosphatase MutT (NUDIX family)
MKHMTLLFLEEDEQLLLAMKKRGFGKGHFNGVGGKVEAGESIKEAMCRECFEEINVKPKSYIKKAELHFTQYLNGELEEMLVHVFIGDKWEGLPKESEEMKPKWFKKDKLPYKQMWPDDEHWLPHVLNGKLVYGKFAFNKEDILTLKNVEVVDV